METGEPRRSSCDCVYHDIVQNVISPSQLYRFNPTETIIHRERSDYAPCDCIDHEIVQNVVKQILQPETFNSGPMFNSRYMLRLLGSHLDSIQIEGDSILEWASRAVSSKHLKTLLNVLDDIVGIEGIDTLLLELRRSNVSRKNVSRMNRAILKWYEYKINSQLMMEWIEGAIGVHGKKFPKILGRKKASRVAGGLTVLRPQE
jgi:hypothetical protein